MWISHLFHNSAIVLHSTLTRNASYIGFFVKVWEYFLVFLLLLLLQISILKIWFFPRGDSYLVLILRAPTVNFWRESPFLHSELCMFLKKDDDMWSIVCNVDFTQKWLHSKILLLQLYSESKKTCRKRELDRYAKILNVIILMNSMSIQIFTELFEMIIIFNESLGMKKATCGAIMSDDLEDIFFIADFSIIWPIHTLKSIARSSTEPPWRVETHWKWWLFQKVQWIIVRTRYS